MTLPLGISVTDCYFIGSCRIYGATQVFLAVWHVFLLSFRVFLYFMHISLLILRLLPAIRSADSYPLNERAARSLILHSHQSAAKVSLNSNFSYL
jgi:hypothetical protein